MHFKKMKIIDKKINQIISESEINSKFIAAKHSKLDINCNILKKNFFIDTYNYFPLTEEYYSFLDIFMWGDSMKYENFNSSIFLENFEKNKKNFKSLKDIFVLGSSPFNNYYRNIITFLPRIFFIKEKKIKLAIHRNCSNKLRNFIQKFCDQMNIEIQFIFLDNGFYKFTNSKIPQFLQKKDSISILNTLKNTNNLKKEKIYITRQNSAVRNLINERDVFNKLKKSGFRMIDLNNFNVFEQINLFSNAEVIVSATGSGLTNIVFCNEGTKIIEICPKYNFDYENNFKSRFSFIAKNLRLKYFQIVADPIKVDKIDINIQNTIAKKIIEESNYYKDLLLKLEKIDNII